VIVHKTTNIDSVRAEWLGRIHRGQWNRMGGEGAKDRVSPLLHIFQKDDT